MATILFLAVAGLFAISIIVLEIAKIYTAFGVAGVVAATSLAVIGVVK